MLTPGKRALGQVLKSAFGKKEEKLEKIPAKLGRYNSSGQEEISVPGHADFVWVRVRGQTSETVRAFNETVGLNFDSPVLIARDALDPRYYRIIRRDTAKYQDWSNTEGGLFTLPPHGHQHSFGGFVTGSIQSGNDPAWIYKRQLMQPLLCHPNVPATMVVYVESDFYFWSNSFRYFSGGLSPDMTPYIPATAGRNRLVTIYLHGDTGTVRLLVGPIFTLSFADTIVPYIPELPANAGLPLAVAYLVSTTTAVDWVNLFDIRIMLFTGYGALPGPHGLDPNDGFHTGQLLATHSDVTDPHGVFTGPTVEDALYELYLNDSSGGGSGGGAGGGGPAVFIQTEYAGGDINIGLVTDGGWVDVDAVNAAISITPTSSGSFRVTFNFTHFIHYANDSNYNTQVAFRITDGSTNLSPVTFKLNSAVSGNSVNSPSGPLSLSGIFTWSGTTARTVKLQKYVIAAGAMDVDSILASGGETLHMDILRLGSGTDNSERLFDWSHFA